MNSALLIKINWIYNSIKEQYKFINSLLNQCRDNFLLNSLEKEIYYYRTSLILFKKSFSSFQEAYNKKHFDDLTINMIKELYLRRCLININKSYELLIKNANTYNNFLLSEIVNKEKILISSIKDLGRNLERIK